MHQEAIFENSAEVEWARKNSLRGGFSINVYQSTLSDARFFSTPHRTKDHARRYQQINFAKKIYQINVRWK